MDTRTHNAQIDNQIVEMNADEIASLEALQKEISDNKKAAEKEATKTLAAKTALLERLGISEEEAQLLK
jgi:hypothetical protein